MNSKGLAGWIWIIIAAVLVISGVILIVLFGKSNTESSQKSNVIGMPNPASVYCVEHGGNLSIRTDENGGQYGVCVFSDGSECEEWRYFSNNGTC